MCAEFDRKCNVFKLYDGKIELLTAANSVKPSRLSADARARMAARTISFDISCNRITRFSF